MDIFLNEPVMMESNAHILLEYTRMTKTTILFVLLKKSIHDACLE